MEIENVNVLKCLLYKDLYSHENGLLPQAEFLKLLIKLFTKLYDCLVSLVVLNSTATLEVLGSIPRSSKKCYWVLYEILSSSSELGFVPG